MKKTLVALAVLGTASGFAFAASSVTLYGKIDQSVVVQKAKTFSETTTDLRSGFNAGSRFGIRGTEDLGKGFSVGFQLEQGFYSDNGAAVSSGLQFNRQSTLHVQGAFGRIVVGRMGALTSGTGSYTLVNGNNIDPFGYGYGVIGAINNNVMVNTSRMDNTVAYVSPNFGGVTVSAMYSNGISADDNAWDENNHYYGIGANYASKGFNGVAVFEMRDNDGAKGEARGNDYIVTLGAAYDFGFLKPYLGVQYAAQKDIAEQAGAQLGLTAPVAGGKVSFAVKYLDGELKGGKRVLGEKDYGMWGVAAAYQYPLSKRTFVYGFGGYADGDKAYKNAAGVAGVKSIYGLAAGATADKMKANNAAQINGWVAAIGIQHNF